MLDKYGLDDIPKSLLTVANPKTDKGENHGYLTAILHLAPASLSGRNVCPHSTAGCRAACLNTAGRGGIGLDAAGLNTIQAARIRRTRFFQRDRALFMWMLCLEIEGHIQRAAKLGLKPAVRLNGTSDLPWEKFPVDWRGQTHPNIMAAFVNVSFYDYTKWPLAKRALDKAHDYHLTFSYSEHPESERRALEYLSAGLNVAVVYATPKGRPLPSRDIIAGEEVPVLDADSHDLRFLDKPGHIAGLRAKGRAKTDTSGFVRAI
jgi:hypothetical protein